MDGLIFANFLKQNNVILDADQKNTKNSSEINDVEKMEGTYEGVHKLDEMDDNIQNAINVSSSQNKEDI